MPGQMMGIQREKRAPHLNVAEEIHQLRIDDARTTQNYCEGCPHIVALLYRNVLK